MAFACGASRRLIMISLRLGGDCKHIQETERLVADPAPGISAAPHDDNLRYFDVSIQGPDGSPFASAYLFHTIEGPLRISASALQCSLQSLFLSPP